MNIGTFVTPNPKGQIVIPLQYRKSHGIDSSVLLNIFPLGDGLFMRPVKTTPEEYRINSKALLIKILNETRGSWGPETKEEKRMEKIRGKKALEEAKKMCQAW